MLFSNFVAANVMSLLLYRSDGCMQYPLSSLAIDNPSARCMSIWYPLYILVVSLFKSTESNAVAPGSIVVDSAKIVVFVTDV